MLCSLSLELLSRLKSALGYIEYLARGLYRTRLILRKAAMRTLDPLAISRQAYCEKDLKLIKNTGRSIWDKLAANI